MIPYLVYWRDLSFAEWPRATRLAKLDWHTASASLLRAVEKDDLQLWVVTHGGDNAPDEWRLAEVFEVPLQKPGPKNPWGKRRITGTAATARVFAYAQGDFAPVLGQLTFVSGRAIPAIGRRIGQFIQCPRRLSAGDVQLLSAKASTLPSRS